MTTKRVEMLKPGDRILWDGHNVEVDDAWHHDGTVFVALNGCPAHVKDVARLAPGQEVEVP